MRALRPLVTLAVLALLGGPLPAFAANDERAEAGERAEAVRGLLDRVAACTGAPAPLALTVAGLAREETVLSDGEAERLRLAVEREIEAVGGSGVRLLPARDVSRLRALREGTTGLSGAEAEALIDRANSGDAAVFLVAPSRGEGGSIRVALQAVSTDAGCKTTTAPVAVTLRAAGGRDPDRLIASALDELNAAAREMDHLALCPLRTEGGHSACAPVLSERVAALATREARRASRVLTGNPLSVSRAAPAQCGADVPSNADVPGNKEVPDGEAVIARGVLSGGTGEGTWLSLEFRQGPRVLAALPRTRIDASTLGCDPTPLPFLDFVARTAGGDRRRIDISAAATPFRPGERLEIAMSLSAPTALHCWVLAPDGTGFVALPAAPDAPPVEGSARYPVDFGLGDIVLSGAFENLFQCFAPAAPLPGELARQWREGGPAGGAPRLLEADEVEAMLSAMRAQPGMGEATTRVVVR